ncbi:MAG: GNAT family N-acetyltransferase [Desulfobacter postgatei]|uniref:GNAT family N-acetyltransferase n=1 Tax=Desulfobacter postgatei TaxID=2293 RepID=UPI0023F15709|nr:GNAT family N-acetyltransferase [Desulfobacter postgatei]MDD4274553.1 GNAT family N-acetyltransferase [Desulfobacter postgatei]
MATDPYGDLLNEFRENASLYDIVYKETARMMDTPPWKSAYISAKLVRGEPLYEALIKLDFTEIEHRRLYTCKIGDLKGTPISQFDDSIRFCSLTDLSAKKLSYYQDQIVELCREGFHSGYTRHFADEFFFKKKSGVEYISTAMKLNFEFADHRHFLIALDEYESQICGFTVIGSKSWLSENIHTQLLSAVSKAYRGKGIYRGLTDLLSQTFPPDTKLLNVTHIANQKIQRAYQDSGRTHIADTVVLRRIFI